uniref:Uncharacterized protein n=1 Tax=uncultured marine virus TaxID=186617 RepID=A0A0F7L596_9VIRU|nr:hypothetical protein [uncultured marine virus]
MVEACTVLAPVARRTAVSATPTAGGSDHDLTDRAGVADPEPAHLIREALLHAAHEPGAPLKQIGDEPAAASPASAAG